MPGFIGTKPNPARYNTDHRRERRRLQPTVDAGLAYCQQGATGNGSSGTCIHPTRWIKPGTPWALGHNDTGTAWIGPVHADCNTKDAATRGAQASHRKPSTVWRSRSW